MASELADVSSSVDLRERRKIANDHPNTNLVALYRAMRLRFGYGFESCDANGPRNVKNT